MPARGGGGLVVLLIVLVVVLVVDESDRGADLEPGERSGSPGIGRPAPPRGGVRGEVNRVIDGDTIEVVLDAAIDGVEEQEPSRESPPSPDGRPADWICDGTLSASQLSAVIRGQPSKQVQTCYERRLKDNNLLQGSMTVLLTIGSSGSVKAISVDGTLNDRQVYSCVKRVAKSWKFPQPGDGCVRTSVPFQMMPKL